MTPFEIFRKPINLYRKVAGAYVSGIWVEGAEVLILITASVQPTTGEEMLSIPEARRNRKSYALYTSTKIEVIHTGKNPDQVLIDGKRFEVIKVDIWQNNPTVFNVVNHYKFLVSALEATP